jgi:hypothetical protein
VSLRTRCVTAGPPLVGSTGGTCRIWVLLSGGNRTAAAAG